jgi:hypothetical protein
VSVLAPCRECDTVGAAVATGETVTLDVYSMTDERMSPRGVKDEPIRLGGMALANGVLVHGPSAWACAVRTADGELRLASGRKRIRAAEVESPFLRGPARVAELLALVPEVRRRLPEARLAFERPAVLSAMAASAAFAQFVRHAGRLRPAAREFLGTLASLAPAVVALRGSALAAYHGAEHISIGSYEHGDRRPREHERCGSHLVGPLVLGLTLGNTLAGRFPPETRGLARAAASVGALAASTEVFAWMVRNPEHPVSKALALPGHELQHRLATADPTPEQLEVADAALAECLRLERDDGRQH